MKTNTVQYENTRNNKGNSSCSSYSLSSVHCNSADDKTHTVLFLLLLLALRADAAVPVLLPYFAYRCNIDCNGNSYAVTDTAIASFRRTTTATNIRATIRDSSTINKGKEKKPILTSLSLIHI